LIETSASAYLIAAPVDIHPLLYYSHQTRTLPDSNNE